MPAPEPSLDAATVRSVLDEHLHAPVATDRVGLEVEWLLSDPADRTRRPGLAEVDALREGCGALPHGGQLTVEPGGQLELVTEPFASIDELCEAATGDLVHLARSLATSPLELVALGCDPVRAPQRVTDAPRYRAMQEHFDHRNDAGRTMMCNTAAIQLNVGRGEPGDEERRWRVANLLGPVLVASFANSPFDDRGASGWRSTRLRTWGAIDPSRAAPVPLDAPMLDVWERYVLDASLMLVRRAPDEFAAIPPGYSFERWMRNGHELGWPTVDDLAYHLTTLFPPVRPRGWLELRMLDTLPSPYWLAAAAVASVLLDPAVDEEVSDAIDGTGHLWTEAATVGLGHDALAVAARRCFAIAREHLAEVRADDAVQAVVAAFEERWVQTGRCPADEVLDRWADTAALFPDAMAAVPFADLAASLV